MMKENNLVRISKKDFIAFKGNKLIYAQSPEDNNEPITFSRTLTKEEIDLLDENPELLSRPENLYLQLTHDLKWVILTLDQDLI
jgi:hypothetical protein